MSSVIDGRMRTEPPKMAGTRAHVNLKLPHGQQKLTRGQVHLIADDDWDVTMYWRLCHKD